MIPEATVVEVDSDIFIYFNSDDTRLRNQFARMGESFFEKTFTLPAVVRERRVKRVSLEAVNYL